MLEKVHYLKNGYDACGRAGNYPTLSSKINEVTCNACRITVTGHKAGGRPKRTDGRNKVQFVLSDKAILKLKELSKGNRSKIVSDWLENLT